MEFTAEKASSTGEVDQPSNAPAARILAWMDRHPAIQMISVAARPLYPLVTAGSFRSTLYYRLNTFYFVL